MYTWCLICLPPPLCVLSGSLSLSLPTHTQEGGVLLMDSIVGNQRERTQQETLLRESILLLLSRWYALQTAVQNQWGGCDSLQKSQQLASDIFSLFSKSNAPVPVEDLESLLHESMLLTFNTEIEDGSIEEAGRMET